MGTVRRISLRAALSAAESGSVLTWILALPGSVILILFAAISPLSRYFRVRGLFGIRGLTFGRLILLFYGIWIALDRNVTRQGGRPVQWVRKNWFTRLYRRYFQASVRYDFDQDEAVLNVDRPHVLGLHPHGAFAIGVFANAVFHDLLPSFQLRTVTIRENFFIPFWRDFLLSLGFIDSSKETLSACLQQGISVGIVVGGADEALNARPNTADLTLDTRMGFIRLALQHGAALVPVYNFGENDLFRQLLPNPPGSTVRGIQDTLKGWMGFSLPALVPAMPAHKQVTTVVGRPIDLPLLENPMPDEIEHWHGVYLRALTALFNKYQPELAPNTTQGITLSDQRPPAAKL